MSKQQLSTNTFTTAQWIVSPILSEGTHTTIQGAINSASAGQTIFIRPGTYTEDIVHKAGVNVTAFLGDADINNVIVLGTWEISGQGIFAISNIQLQTNSNYAIIMDGSDDTVLHIEGVLIAASNNTAINYSTSNTSSVLSIFDSVIGVNDPFSAYTMSSTGKIQIFETQVVGLTTTASSNSDGLVSFYSSQMGIPFSTSSTGSINFSNCRLDTAAQNSVSLTTEGTGGGLIQNCEVYSGTASCVSVGVGTSVKITSTDTSSSNANVLTGAGTLQYAYISFSGTSSGHNVTTETALTQLT